jgi:hypothetical protein
MINPLPLQGLHKLQLIRDAKRICPDAVIVLGEVVSSHPRSDHNTSSLQDLVGPDKVSQRQQSALPLLAGLLLEWPGRKPRF